MQSVRQQVRTSGNDQTIEIGQLLLLPHLQSTDARQFAEVGDVFSEGTLQRQHSYGDWHIRTLALRCVCEARHGFGKLADRGKC